MHGRSWGVQGCKGKLHLGEWHEAAFLSGSGVARTKVMAQAFTSDPASALPPSAAAQGGLDGGWGCGVGDSSLLFKKVQHTSTVKLGLF